ncbi:hypothetical protein ABIF90_007217 [Bradyrhizobium japonicum]
MRQMGRKRTTAGAAPFSTLACACRVLPVLDRFIAGNGLLDVLDRQLQLLRVELLRAATELRALQLAQEMLKAIHLRQRLIAFDDRRVALCDRRVALRTCRRNQRLQRLDIGRKLIRGLAHARYSS